MMQRRGAAPPRRGLAADALRGGIAGAAGWWVMDHALQLMYDHEDRSARERETRARGGVPALEVAAQRGARLAGIELAPRQRQEAGTAVQWLVGIGGGMLYGVFRPRLAAARAGRGLAYGAAFSLVVDEGLVPLLGLAPGPAAFPWQTHARGFAGHLLFGLVADAALEVLEGTR